LQPAAGFFLEGRQPFNDAVSFHHVEDPLPPLFVVTEIGAGVFQDGAISEVHGAIVSFLSRSGYVEFRGESIDVCIANDRVIPAGAWKSGLPLEALR
jgi:hypothetical protein